MKKLMIVLPLLAACSTPKPTWSSGKAVAEPPAPLTKLESAPVDSEITVEGTVTRVCQKRGCWVEITDGTTTVMAKSLEHDVLFPKDCAGKKARIVGIVRTQAPAEEEGDDCPNPKRLVEIVGAQLY